MSVQRHPDDAVADAIRVLVVDDEPGFADLAATCLEREVPSLTGHAATSAADALETLDLEPIDCVVSDYQMPEMDGLALLEVVREDHPDLPFLLFTGKGSEEIASEAISAGVTDYLQKGGAEQYALLANRVRNAVERYRARTALSEREERFRHLIEGATDLVAVLDEVGRFTYLGPSVEEILGYRSAELEGEAAIGYVHPDDHDRVTAAMESIVADPDGTATEQFRLRGADGEWRYIEATGRNMLDTPAVEGVVLNGRDVTDRVERERIIETVPDGIYVTDADGRYVEVNDRVEEVTGYDREALVGSHASMLIPEEALAELEAAIAELLGADERDFARIEHPIETADGGTILVEARLALRPTGPDGGFRGTIGVARDVTERIVREWQLERQNERLEEFTEVVSHDLRNPLTVADGYLELARGTADSETDAHLERVETSHERMDALISDLLSLSRSGQAVENPDAVTLTKASQDAWATTATADATLTVDSSTVIRADVERLHQLLENLYRNAVEHGGDQVSVGLLDGGDGFYVADDGPGIPEAERDDVFEHGFTTREDGTGLGLTIVRNVTEAHGWSVSVTESDSGGARFEFTGVETA